MRKSVNLKPSGKGKAQKLGSGSLGRASPVMGGGGRAGKVISDNSPKGNNDEWSDEDEDRASSRGAGGNTSQSAFITGVDGVYGGGKGMKAQAVEDAEVPEYDEVAGPTPPPNSNFLVVCENIMQIFPGASGSSRR